jgi:hypothetical protein
MNKFLKPLIIITTLILLSIFVYFAYPVIKNRYFNPAPTTSIENSPEPISTTQSNLSNNSESPNSTETPTEETATPNIEDSLSGETTPADPKAIINLNERGTPDSENLAHITTEHCTNNCDAFAMDFKLIEYCQQVCGLVPVKEISNCDDKKDLEKDYCLKDLAVTKKDSKLCNDIQDANIRLTCQNRILEDIIESQPKSEPVNF